MRKLLLHYLLLDQLQFQPLMEPAHETNTHPQSHPA